MIPISQALKIIKRETFSLENETVELSEVVGRVLAEEIRADMDLPPFDRSQMDGFAVKTKDTKNAPVKLKIVGESVAGKGWHNELNPGEAVRIMTGAFVPTGADSVQMVELTEEENGFIKILKPTKENQNVVRKSAEMKSGEKVFDSGEIVSENMIATLASFGYEKTKVAKRPKVIILATGSEIVDVSETPKQDQIRNSNSWMLAAFAKKFADVEMLPIAKDDLENLKDTINAAIKSCDCLIISGGVSVGDYDFTKPALREIGAEIFFEKVSLKPGKPTVFAKLENTLIFGLPGNPVSVAVTFFAFVRTALLLMQNAKNSELEKGFAKLTHPIKATKERDALLPVSLKTNKKGHLTIETLRFSGSSNFIAFSQANALVFVPQDKSLEQNDVAEIYFLP
jgi:molybdenum cofactor synthesis domain-containing protein